MLPNILQCFHSDTVSSFCRMNSVLDIFDQPYQYVHAVLCSVRYSKRLEYGTGVSGNEMVSPVPKGSWTR